MYKTSFWGVLTHFCCCFFFVLELLPFFLQSHSHISSTSLRRTSFVIYRLLPADSYLSCTPILGCNFFNFRILWFFGNIYAYDFCLCATFVQIIYLVKLPRKRLCCFLLCLSFLNSSWLYFVWQFLFYCGKKNGLTDKGFWDPNLLIAVCMASLCFLDWWVAWHWLWAKDGLSHINYTVASKHCTLAHVNCVKKAFGEPTTMPESVSPLLHVCRNVWPLFFCLMPSRRASVQFIWVCRWQNCALSIAR